MYVTNFLLYRFVILVNTYCHIMAQMIKDLCLIYVMVNGTGSKSLSQI